MNKEIAEKLINELIGCQKAIDSAEIISREIEDENLRMEFRKILEQTSLDLYSEAMVRLIKLRELQNHAYTNYYHYTYCCWVTGLLFFVTT